MALRLGDTTRRNPFSAAEEERLRKARAGRTEERRANRQWSRSGSTYGQMRGIGGGIAGRGFGMLDTGYSTAKRLLGDLEKDLDPAAARQRAVNEAAVNAEIAAKSARGTLERNLTGTGGTRLGSGRAVGAMKDLEMRSAAMKAGEMNRAARAAGKESQADLRAGLDAASRMSGQGVSAIGTGLGGLDSSAGGQMRLGGLYDERSAEEADTSALLDPNLQQPRYSGTINGQRPRYSGTINGVDQQRAPVPPGGTGGRPADQVVTPTAPGTVAGGTGGYMEPEVIGAEPSGNAPLFNPADGIPQDPGQQDSLLAEIGYNPAQLNRVQREEILRMWQTGKLPNTGKMNVSRRSGGPMVGGGGGSINLF